MIIKETTSQNSEMGDDVDSHIEIELTTEDGTSSVSFGEGEPEDMTLFRDLADAYSISDLLVMAYNAGKRGEELEIINETDED